MKKTPVFKLNPKSDRYRTCPECKTAFMTEHLGKDFCGRKCANDYNNRKKRLDTHAKILIDNLNVIDNSKLEIQSHSEVLENEQFVQVIPQNSQEKIYETTAIVVRSIDPGVKKLNEDILSKLLGEAKEVQVSWKYFVELGFNFKAFDYLEQLPKCNLRKANYGNYSLIWVKPEMILLTYQYNLLWT